MNALNSNEPNKKKWIPYKKKKSKFLISLVEKESTNLKNLLRNGVEVNVKNEFGGM